MYVQGKFHAGSAEKTADTMGVYDLSQGEESCTYPAGW
jgi:hypothetical protein